MFACSVEWGLRDTNPATGVRKFREWHKDRFLDAAEVGRLLSALETAEAEKSVSTIAIAAIRVLLYTGMRSGEVSNMRWSDVDEARQCFVLADTKTGCRVIPYGQQAKDALATLTRGAPGDYVFEGAKTGTPISMRRPWYLVRGKADIDASATLHTPVTLSRHGR